MYIYIFWMFMLFVYHIPPDNAIFLPLTGFIRSIHSSYSSIYPGWYSNNNHLPSIGVCSWQRYTGTYMLWLFWYSNDGIVETIPGRSIRYTESAGSLSIHFFFIVVHIQVISVFLLSNLFFPASVCCSSFFYVYSKAEVDAYRYGLVHLYENSIFSHAWCIDFSYWHHNLVSDGHCTWKVFWLLFLQLMNLK